MRYATRVSRSCRNARSSLPISSATPNIATCLAGTEVAAGAHRLRNSTDRGTSMTGQPRDIVTKVPAVTLGFWIIKILATTLGETGGDTVTMTMNLGYLVGTAIFFSALVALAALQISVRKFHPILYWATIVASTTAGTTMADFADRSLGIGYTGGSLILLLCLLGALALWYRSEGSVSVTTITTPKVAAFYWATITFS